MDSTLPHLNEPSGRLIGRLMDARSPDCVWLSFVTDNGFKSGSARYLLTS
jgi:hypothetical protein